MVGIDVGGAVKGFHGVALRSGAYHAQFAACDVREVVEWCRKIDARVVGVDAPCQWSVTGRARAAERQLAAKRISSFATPSRETAERHNFYRWMINGAALYAALAPHYPLFDGEVPLSGRACFETFPHAVASSLSQGIPVPAKRKRAVRRCLLQQAGIETDYLSNIDLIDAGLCALTANHLLAGKVTMHGDAREGFIVVPR